MTNQEIKELLQIFDESGVAEMEVQRGDNRLRLRRVPTAQELTIPSLTPSAPTQAPAPFAFARLASLRHREPAWSNLHANPF